jgi:hypothetical protein
MKESKLSIVHPRSENFWSQPPTSDQAETALFIILGLAALVALLMAAGCSLIPTHTKHVSMATSVQSAPINNRPIPEQV